MPTVSDSMPHPVGALYREHAGWLQGWLSKKLGNTFDAADLAHDTFLRVLSRDVAHELVEPRAFLGTVAHGLMVNLLRRRSLEQAYLEALACHGLQHSPSPEERALIVDALVQIDAMLDGLPAQVRRAFLLLQLEGLSHAEIAERLKVSVSSVRQYIARAMQNCLLLR